VKVEEYDTPLTDALYTGPCRLPITIKHRDHARALEKRLRKCRMLLDAIASGFELVWQYKRTSDRIRACLEETNLSGPPSGDAEKQPGANASRTDTPVNER